MGSPITILSMDGGNGLNTAELLTQLENVDHAGFLDRTDIFTGTSAGGINSLFFAASKSPTSALADLKEFWNDVNRSILEGVQSEAVQQRLQLKGQHAPPLESAPSTDLENVLRAAFGLSMAAAGWRSLFLNDVLKAFLGRHFGDMRLGDLPAYVVIITLQLDKRPASQSSEERSWGPKLYTKSGLRRARAKGNSWRRRRIPT